MKREHFVFDLIFLIPSSLLPHSIYVFKILINPHQFHACHAHDIALPEFVKRPQDVKTGINSAVKLECSALGNPQPSVFWTKEGSHELMFPDNAYGRVHITAEGTLEIQNVQKVDAGFYVCSAFSTAGSGTVRAFVDVS